MTARESIIPVFVPHLGCPNNCVFCNQNRISGSLSPATEDDVAKAVETAAALYDTSRSVLAFYGGSFTAIPAQEQTRLLDKAEQYVRRGLIAGIRMSTRPDAIDDAVLERLSRYTVKTIEIGAQSLDDEVLRLSGRGHSAAQVENAARLIKAHGYELIIQMMTGLPGDSTEKSVATARKIIALKPDGVRIYPTVIIKDTALYELWKQGKYSEHSVEDAVELCAILQPMFYEAQIPVIRLGLNPTEDLTHSDAVGGAYHPALGEMVMARVMRNKAEDLIAGSGRKVITLLVNPTQISQMVGQHRANIEYLTEKYFLVSLRVKGAEVEKFTVRRE